MKYFFYVLACVILLASGWFGRGILDGSLISRTEADDLTKTAVKDALKRKEQRDAAETPIQQSIQTVEQAAKIVPSASCPPGTGVMSDDIANGLRDAYGAPRH